MLSAIAAAAAASAASNIMLRQMSNTAMRQLVSISFANNLFNWSPRADVNHNNYNDNSINKCWHVVFGVFAYI
jgi:hypothetical protein